MASLSLSFAFISTFLPETEDIQLKEARKQVLEKHNFGDEKKEICLTNEDPLPQDLLNFVRLAAMTEEEIYFHDESKGLGSINPRNELQTLVTLKRALKSQYSTHPELIKKALSKVSILCQKSTSTHLNETYELCKEPNILKLENFVKEKNGKINDLGIAIFPSTGRGIVTLKDIPENEVILEIPRNLLFNIDAAYESPKLGKIFKEIEGLHDDSILILFLIYETFLNQESFWKPYFDTLPELLSSPLLFDVQELLQLDGTSLLEETIQVKEQLRLTHEMLFPELSNYYPDVFPSSIFTIEKFLWARAIFDSRAINMKIGGQVKTCLVPFVDMINHSFHAHVPAGQFDDNLQVFKLTANSPCPSGQQIFLHYGALKNWQLLLYYGFLIQENYYDTIPIYFELPEDDLMEQKRDLMDFLNLSCEHFIKKNYISPKAFASLRISLANKEELDAVISKKVNPKEGSISQRNEIEMLKSFEETLESLLNIILDDGNQMDEDEDNFESDYLDNGESSKENQNSKNNNNMDEDVEDEEINESELSGNVQLAIQWKNYQKELHEGALNLIQQILKDVESN